LLQKNPLLVVHQFSKLLLTEVDQSSALPRRIFELVQLPPPQKVLPRSIHQLAELMALFPRLF
jgi:hypothetical protein